MSLQIVLNEIAYRERITVVVLGEREATPREETWGGIHVIRLPQRGPWPFHNQTRAGFEQLRRLPALFRAAAFAFRSLTFLGGRPLRQCFARLAAFAVWLRYKTNLPVATDFFVAREQAPEMALDALIARLRPRLIHADNHDAICAVAGRYDVPVVGFVRDNRFLCARQDQAAAIEGKACVVCGADCIATDAAAAGFTRNLIRLTAAYRQNCLAGMTRIVVASRYLERQLGNIVSPKLICRVVNPVAVPMEAPGVQMPKAETSIAVVGSLTAKKGQAALLCCLPRMLAEIPGLHLHFLGSGPDAVALRRIAEQYGAAAKITLHGYLAPQALQRVLATCDIVAIPSLWAEPFGRSAIEAAAMGLPVVAFAIGGLAELVQTGETGVLVAPGDFTAFVDALAMLAADAALRRKFGDAGRDAVLREHAPGRVAAELTAVWCEALAVFKSEIRH